MTLESISLLMDISGGTHRASEAPSSRVFREFVIIDEPLSESRAKGR